MNDAELLEFYYSCAIRAALRMKQRGTYAQLCSLARQARNRRAASKLDGDTPFKYAKVDQLDAQAATRMRKERIQMRDAMHAMTRGTPAADFTQGLKPWEP